MTKALREQSRPEFLNRIDEIITFEPLTEREPLRIVELMAEDVAQRPAERGITLLLTEAAKQALVAQGYDPVYGARPRQAGGDPAPGGEAGVPQGAGRGGRRGRGRLVDHTPDVYMRARQQAVAT